MTENRKVTHFFLVLQAPQPQNEDNTPYVARGVIVGHELFLNCYTLLRNQKSPCLWGWGRGQACNINLSIRVRWKIIQNGEACGAWR